MDTRIASRRPVGAAIMLGVAVLAGCGPGIGGVNGRPEQFYGKRVTFTGRIGDVLVRDAAGKVLVFHLVSGSGERIIVVTSRPTSRHRGDSVRVQGTFSAEHTLGDQKFYDVLVVDSVRRPRRFGIPFLP